MELIDKNKVVEEINRILDSYDPNEITSGRYELVKLRNFLDTLEVKEVDLDFEQELYKAFGQVKDFTLGMRIAKHFYELGIKTKKGE